MTPTCHPERRYFATGLCSRCYASARYRANPRLYCDRARRWRTANPDKVRATHKNWTRANPDKMRAIGRRQRHGVEPPEFVAMLSKQGGRCAICWLALEGRSRNSRPHVDHDHVVFKVRGLLCNSCNIGLGKFNDSPDLLVAAGKYILEHRRPATAPVQ